MVAHADIRALRAVEGQAYYEVAGNEAALCAALRG